MNVKISMFVICVDEIKYLLLYHLHYCTFKYTLQTALLTVKQFKTFSMKTKIVFLQYYTKVPLHLGKLHRRCKPLAIQSLIPSNCKLFAGWCKLRLPVNSVVYGKLFLHRRYFASTMAQWKSRTSILFSPEFKWNWWYIW